MLRITDEFFLYNLELNDGCVLVRTNQEIPAEQLNAFSHEVGRVAKVRQKPGLYRYRGQEYEDKLQGIIKVWKEKPGLEAFDVEHNIREDLTTENDAVVFEGILLRVVYQYASW